MEKYIILKLQNEFIFWKKKYIIHFVKVETDPRLQYSNQYYVYTKVAPYMPVQYCYLPM